MGWIVAILVGLVVVSLLADKLLGMWTNSNDSTAAAERRMLRDMEEAEEREERRGR